MRQVLLGLALLLASWGAQAACNGGSSCSGVSSISCTAGTTASQVNTCVSQAPDGATLTFASGSYTWSGTTIEFSNSKGVTLQGAGIDSSVVTIGSAPIIGMSNTISGTNNKCYRITGFTFQNAPSNLIFWFYGNGTLNCFRIDHNRFHDYDLSAIAIFIGATDSGVNTVINGVIDNNQFTGAGNFMIMKYLSYQDLDVVASTRRGTVNNMFLEDNLIDFDDNDDLGSGCVDIWQGGAVVVRYNDTTNCLWTAHGVTHGGVLNFEFYRNLLRRTSGVTWDDCTRCFHHQGSGEIYAFQNTFYPIGTIGGALALTHYRSATPAAAGYSTGLDRCDGSSTGLPDGNVLANGWPCWFQPGRAPAGGSPAYGSLAPVYVWGNVNNSTGAKVDMEIENPWGATSPSVADHLAANRDYYNAVSVNAQSSASSPFNGTTGMGFGTLSNRPTTCSTGTDPESSGLGGVGYWATNIGEWNAKTSGPDGQLYRCTSGNVWVVHYKPYAYPHPLVVAAGPAPPTNIQAIIASWMKEMMAQYGGNTLKVH